MFVATSSSHLSAPSVTVYKVTPSTLSVETLVCIWESVRELLVPGSACVGHLTLLSLPQLCHHPTHHRHPSLFLLAQVCALLSRYVCE